MRDVVDHHSSLCTLQESRLLAREIAKRRFSRHRLYTGGKILHIVRRKKTELEK